MTKRPWPIVTCRDCGSTGPGRGTLQLCHRCHQRRRHPRRVCDSCGLERRHIAVGMCGPCYRKSVTQEHLCPECGETRPIEFGTKCERCKRQARVRVGACRACGRHVLHLYGGKCRPCRCVASTADAHCRDCGDYGEITRGRCRGCYDYFKRHPMGVCSHCGGQYPIGPTGSCRMCMNKRRFREVKKDPLGSKLLHELSAYGNGRGWSSSTVTQVRRSLRVILANRDRLGHQQWPDVAVRELLCEFGGKPTSVSSSSSSTKKWSNPTPTTRSTAG